MFANSLLLLAKPVVVLWIHHAIIKKKNTKNLWGKKPLHATFHKEIIACMLEINEIIVMNIKIEEFCHKISFITYNLSTCFHCSEGKLKIYKLQQVKCKQNTIFQHRIHCCVSDINYF